MTTHVLLVHGLGRTPLSLARLGRALRRDGHRTHTVGNVAGLQSVDRIVTRVRGSLDALLQDSAPVVVVTHSLGGILVRAALAAEPLQVRLPDHLVMLAPPNQAPQLARQLHRLWPYRLINGEVGQRLAEPAFLEGLPPVPVPHTIIAGTAGPTGRWSPFGDRANDGIVTVDETRPTPEAEVIELPLYHTFLMNDARVRAIITEVVEGVAASRVT
jgi:hypothetical protein